MFTNTRQFIDFFADKFSKVNSDDTKPLDTLIGETKSLISSQHSNTNNLINALKVGSVPIVKSVQRGSFSESKEKNTDDMIITVSAINTNKAILILNSPDISGVSSSSNDYSTYYHPSGYIVDSTHIALSRSRHNSESSSYYFRHEWQVIEFY